MAQNVSGDDLSSDKRLKTHLRAICHLTNDSKRLWERFVIWQTAQNTTSYQFFKKRVDFTPPNHYSLSRCPKKKAHLTNKMKKITVLAILIALFASVSEMYANDPKVSNLVSDAPTSPVKKERKVLCFLSKSWQFHANSESSHRFTKINGDDLYVLSVENTSDAPITIQVIEYDKAGKALGSRELAISVGTPFTEVYDTENRIFSVGVKILTPSAKGRVSVAHGANPEKTNTSKLN